MTTEFKFPDVGEGITEGEIVKWHVKEGDQVKEHDVLVEVETDKAIVEMPSPASGTILKINHKEGETVKVGEVLVVIGEKGETVKKIEEKKPVIKPAGAVGYLEEASEEEVKVQVPQLKTQVQKAPILASPAVRKMAKDRGIDLSAIKGSGPGGIITESDLKLVKQPEIKPGIQPEIKVTKKYDFYGYVERVPLKGVRKSIAKKMVESFSKAVHVTHMDEADVTRLWHLREREKKIAQMKGIKLTFLPFIIKAVIAGLKKHPEVNSTLDEESQEIIYKKYYNIGIAVDTDDGLIVPVIKGAQDKSILDLAKEIEDLSKKARERKLDLADMKGGTFTITNVGSIRGVFATPIINYPESAILALGRIQDRLVAEETKVHVKKILPMSLAFDHRIFDGADAAKFMQTVIERLEDPNLIMMERD